METHQRFQRQSDGGKLNLQVNVPEVKTWQECWSLGNQSLDVEDQGDNAELINNYLRLNSGHQFLNLNKLYRTDTNGQVS